MTDVHIPEPFGPIYPGIPAAAKFRRIPRDKLTADQRRAYSEAIVTKILGLQRAALQRELPSIAPSCASGTWHNNADGKIGEAIRARQTRALLAYPDNARAARTTQELEAAYAAAMRAKRAALVAT